jgi:hypothetical protein
LRLSAGRDALCPNGRAIDACDFATVTVNDLGLLAFAVFGDVSTRGRPTTGLATRTCFATGAAVTGAAAFTTASGFVVRFLDGAGEGNGKQATRE